MQDSIRKVKNIFFINAIGKLIIKNAKKVVDYCHNNTVRKTEMEAYVIKQVSRVIFNNNIIDQVLREYNNSARIEVLEKQIKDIDKQITNIVNAVAMTGSFSELLQQKLTSLENEKKQISENIANEKKGFADLTATKEELQLIYSKAQDILLNGSFEEKKTILSWFFK